MRCVLNWKLKTSKVLVLLPLALQSAMIWINNIFFSLFRSLSHTHTCIHTKTSFFIFDLKSSMGFFFFFLSKQSFIVLLKGCETHPFTFAGNIGSTWNSTFSFERRRVCLPRVGNRCRRMWVRVVAIGPRKEHLVTGTLEPVFLRTFFPQTKD